MSESLTTPSDSSEFGNRPKEPEREILQGKRAEESLRPSMERFHLLVEGIRDFAVLVLGPRGRLIRWNQGDERIQGYRVEEILGRHFSCFYPAEDIQGGKLDHELAVATVEGKFEDEGWRVCQDGSRFWTNVAITALRNHAGTLRGFAKRMHGTTALVLSAIVDITECKRAEQEVAQRCKSSPAPTPNSNSSPTSARRTSKSRSAWSTATQFLAKRDGGRPDAVAGKTPRPDLILLDLNLPQQDGREVLAEIKAAPGLRRIPVINLMASNTDQDILRSYDPPREPHSSQADVPRRVHRGCALDRGILDDNRQTSPRERELRWLGR